MSTRSRGGLALAGLVMVVLAAIAGVALAQSEPDRVPDPSLTPVADERGETVGYVRQGGVITPDEAQRRYEEYLHTGVPPADPVETIYDKFGTPIGTFPPGGGTSAP